MGYMSGTEMFFWKFGLVGGGLLLGWLIGLLFTSSIGLRLVLAGLGILTLLYVIFVPSTAAVVPVAFVAFFVGIFLAIQLTPASRSIKFGSSRWATEEDVRQLGLVGGDGFWLGQFPQKNGPPLTLRYAGDRHLLTCAPTRSGKGTSVIIPTLLTYPGSVLVIDPKGENAMITAAARKAMGQKVYLLDPWTQASPTLGMMPARINPLDWLIPGDLELSEKAMLLSDAVVPSRGANDPFWDDEAKALVYGFMAYLANEPDEANTRNLGRLRDILTLPPRDPRDPDASVEGTLDEILLKMAGSTAPEVRATAARFAQKADKERAGVLSTAQSHTHFLESPHIRASLSATDFSFEDLKTGNVTIYLILPADRLDTFGRWLRLLIQQAITQTARNIAYKPKHPVLFMLDEMAALGPLSMVEQAYSLMAGFGMQLWGIVQDLGQLSRLYGNGWQTFISNAGVVQYFGSRDVMTAEYFSKLCGKTTVKSLAVALSRVFGGGGGSSETSTTTEAQRDLAYPDELMTLRGGEQIVFVESSYPIRGIRTPWYEEASLKDRGVNLRTLRPEQLQLPPSATGHQPQPAPATL